MSLTESIAPKSEEWRAVPDFRGYEVSDLGRVRALDRITDSGRNWRGQMMTPSAMPRGYMVVTLWRAKKQKTELVHRLVLSAFVGTAPEGMEGLHGNGDASDNALSNLRWGTHSENQLDQVSHGTHTKASKEFCPAGHPYDEANTYIYPGRPHRACRVCRRENLRRWQAANPGRAQEIALTAQHRYRAKKKAA